MRILIVEDSPTDRELLRYLLESRFQTESKFREASTLESAIRYLRRGDTDCVLLDLTLPDSAGKETFEKLHKQFPSIPKVIMTASKDRQLALELIKSGASDYIVKDYTNEEELFSRIMYAIEKDKISVRVTEEDAKSFKKLETANANMKTAHQSGEHQAVALYTMETTSEMAKISQRMFAEIQNLSTEVKTQGVRQEQLIEKVEGLDDVVFRGSNSQPSLLSRMDVLDSSLRHSVSDIRELKRNQDENRLSVVGLERDHIRTEARTEAVKEVQAATNKSSETKSNNNTKVVLAIIAALATLAGTVITVLASSDAPTDKKIESK